MKKIIGTLIIIVIIAIESYTLYKMKEEKDIREYRIQMLQSAEESSISDIEADDEEKTEELRYLNLIPEEYKGYNVSAKIDIEKLNLSNYVLEEYSKSAMEVAVSKYFGPNPNEVRKLLCCWT